MAENRPDPQRIAEEESLRARSPEGQTKAKQEKNLLDAVIAIRKSLTDRKALRSPKERAKRKRDQADDKKRDMKVTDRLKTFGKSIAKDMRDGTVGMVGGIISSIPGAKSIGRALGKATEGTKLKSTFLKMIGKGGEDSKQEIDSDATEINIPDLSDGELGQNTKTMIDLLSEIRDKVCFLRDQVPTKLDRKEDKNEQKALAVKEDAKMKALLASQKGGGGEIIQQGGGGGGILGTLIELYLAKKLGAFRLLRGGVSLAGRATMGVARGVGATYRGVRGAAGAARGARAARTASGVVQGTQLARQTPQAARIAQLNKLRAAQGLTPIATSVSGGARLVDSARKTAQVGGAARFATSVGGRAAMGGARAAAGVASLGITEAVYQTLNTMLETSLAEGIALDMISSETAKVKRVKKVDPRTGKVYQQTINAMTGLVDYDPIIDRLNMDGTEPETQIQERTNIRFNRAVRALDINEVQTIQMLQAAVRAHKDGDDTVANGALEAAKLMILERAQVAGSSGISDKDTLEELMNFTPEGEKMMRDLLQEADDMVWEIELLDQDYVDDTIDQLNAFTQGDKADLMDPGDTTSRSALLEKAQTKAVSLQKINERDEAKNINLLEALQTDPSMLKNATPEQIANWRHRLGDAAIDRVMQDQGLISLGTTQTQSDIEAVTLISGSASARSENTLRHQQQTQANIAMMAPTNVTTSTNVNTTNVSGTDSSMNESAFLARKYAQQRAALFA